MADFLLQQSGDYILQETGDKILLEQQTDHSSLSILTELQLPLSTTAIFTELEYPHTRYWVGGTGNWTDTAHWSLSSGGLGGAPVPTSIDSVIIDSNSGFISGGEIDEDGVTTECFNFTSISGHTYTIVYVNSDLNIFGSAVFEAGTVFDSNSFAMAQFSGTGNETITANGATIQAVWLMGSGFYTLLDNLVCINLFKQVNGTFDANDNNITAFNLEIESTLTEGTSTLYMGNGTWEVQGDGIDGGGWSIFQRDGLIVNLIPENSTVKFTNTQGFTAYFLFEDLGAVETGKTYNNIWFNANGTFDITGSNTFNNFKADAPPLTLNFEEGTTTTLNIFDVAGTYGNLVTISSIDSSYNPSSNQHFLSKSSGVVNGSYLDIGNSNAGGGATWYADITCPDEGNNNGWIFTAHNFSAILTDFEKITNENTALLTNFEETTYNTVALNTTLEKIENSTVSLLTNFEEKATNTIAISTTFETIKIYSTTAILTNLVIPYQVSTNAITSTLEKVVNGTTGVFTTLEKIFNKTLPIYTLLEASKNNTTAILTNLAILFDETIPILTILETTDIYTTVGILTTLSVTPQSTTIGILTVLETTQYSTTGILTNLETSIINDIALLTNLEFPTSYSNTAVLTTFETSNIEKTIAVLTNFETIAFYNTVAIFTKLAGLVNSNTGILTNLETSGQNTVALATTLENGKVQTVAILTDLSLLNDTTSAIFTKLEGNKRKTGAILTTFEKYPINKTVAIKTTLETSPFTGTIGIHTKLEKPNKKTIAIYAILENNAKSSTIALLTRLEKTPQKKTLAINTRLNRVVKKSSAILTILETTPADKTIAIRTDFQNPWIVIGFLTILETAPIRNTTAITANLLPFYLPWVPDGTTTDQIHKSPSGVTRDSLWEDSAVSENI